jgi:hypothetical protein
VPGGSVGISVAGVLGGRTSVAGVPGGSGGGLIGVPTGDASGVPSGTGVPRLTRPPWSGATGGTCGITLWLPHSSLQQPSLLQSVMHLSMLPHQFVMHAAHRALPNMESK